VGNGLTTISPSGPGIGPSSRTFASKTDAERWLLLAEAEIIRGDWIDPDPSRAQFGQYARSWVAERPNLRPKTMQLYDGLVRLHLSPSFGALAVQDITEPRASSDLGLSSHTSPVKLMPAPVPAASTAAASGGMSQIRRPRHATAVGLRGRPDFQLWLAPRSRSR
jgi:hypothetical protein